LVRKPGNCHWEYSSSAFCHLLSNPQLAFLLFMHRDTGHGPVTQGSSYSASRTCCVTSAGILGVWVAATNKRNKRPNRLVGSYGACPSLIKPCSLRVPDTPDRYGDDDKIIQDSRHTPATTRYVLRGRDMMPGCLVPNLMWLVNPGLNTTACKL
jgi:hypothetical protein